MTKKKRVAESVAKSQAYNPIRDSQRESRRDSLARRVSRWEPTVTIGETLSETRFFLVTFHKKFVFLLKKIPKEAPKFRPATVVLPLK